jgi:hypothetical protein
MTADEIIAELIKIPDSIFDCDMRIAETGAHLAELKDSLELAELNAELGATMPEGKSNEDTRKKLREQAVSESAQVKLVKSQIRNEQASLSQHEANRSCNLRQFSAMIAIAELASARLNALTMKQKKEIAQWEMNRPH